MSDVCAHIKYIWNNEIVIQLWFFDDGKVADVTIAFWNEDDMQLKYYRKVSIISVALKTFERLIKNELTLLLISILHCIFLNKLNL